MAQNMADLVKQRFVAKIKSGWEKYKMPIGWDNITAGNWCCKADIYSPDNKLLAENKTLIPVGRPKHKLDEFQIGQTMDIDINPLQLSSEDILV